MVGVPSKRSCPLMKMLVEIKNKRSIKKKKKKKKRRGQSVGKEENWT